MSAEKILSEWKKKTFKPIYWLEGEEEYYIDLLMDYAEHHILPESEASFNLTVFYGKDADWAQVINACKRYPMFAEKQVVLLKEAQQMGEIEKLESYVDSPLGTTLFVVGYKGKTLDKRKTLYKTLEKKAEIFKSIKIREEKVGQWITAHVQSRGFTIKPKAVSLLEEHIGNDLNRIVNEIEKLTINLDGVKSIDEHSIEKFIGISKEYNVFELLAAISRKDLARSLKIIQYFDANPKAAPIQMALPALYSHISKVYAVYGMYDKSDKAVGRLFYYNPNSLQQARDIMKNYEYAGVERMLLLLHQYNLKAIGMGDSGTESASLLKEMVVKMLI
jgi:DNA polymerase-3 subunit delta